MRGSVVLVLGVLAVARVGGADDESTDPTHGPARWQAASGAPALSRIWGAGNDLYGVGSSGAYRSTDGGASWSPVDGAGPAMGVWGTGTDDVWIVRARTLHHSYDGAHWSTQALPMLSFGAAIEGMWGADRDRYVFGVDRVDGKPRGVILRSRDGGTSWRAESIPEVDRIAGIWGSAANDVYAVGAKGIVLHSTGDGWTTVRQPTGSGLEGIWGPSATSIYVVGANGTILHSTDGKAWSPRTSGVRYTLSSINGSGNELFAGSADGAPLRSTDGLTWKPVTALIERGHVWAGDSAHAVLASSDVQFLGEATPIQPLPVLPTPGSLLSGRNAAADILQAQSNTYGATYPHARDLLAIASHQLGNPKRLDPRLATLKPPKVTIGHIKGCSSTLDSVGPSAQSGVDVRLDVECTKSCQQLLMSSRVSVTDSQGRTTEISSKRMSTPVRSCYGQNSMVAWAFNNVFQPIEKDYQQRLTDQLDDALRNPNTKPAELFEALATYTLEGGEDPTPRSQLAALVKQPVSWAGFLWNAPGSCWNSSELAQLQTTGGNLLTQGNYNRAVVVFERISKCKPESVASAYVVACQAKSFHSAQVYFDALKRPDSMVQFCLKKGYDPRSQPPTP